MTIKTLADGIYVSDPEGNIFRIDTQTGLGHRVLENGSEAEGVPLRHFHVADGYQVVGKPEAKPKYAVGDLLQSKRYGSVWRVVEADKIVERVTAGVGQPPGFRDCIGNADMWATRVREVTKTEYVPV